MVSVAQVNRSAREFATEKIEEYVQQKLFKNQPYKIISFGELKPYQDKRKEIFWMIDHQFEIVGSKKEEAKKNSKTQTYNFYFYLDEKMEVKKAETYFIVGQ